jgi:hydrogenase maturation protein HypF
VADLKKGVSVSVVSARFHNAVAEMVYEVVLAMRNLYGMLDIVLSGGVWQNITLLTKTMKLLNMANIKVYIHSMVPPNDGGVSLGQAAIAAHHFPTGGK